jgi:LacI family transcriptional regulator
VDGLIVMSPDMDSRVAVRNLPERFPVVLLNCAAGADGNGGEFDAITIENFEGARAMVRHLFSLGHRRVAMIRGAARNLDAAERLRGYRAALAEAGVEAHPAWEVAGDFGEESGYRGAVALLSARPRPTAIFAANDSMAIGALSALREAGVGVPEEMAVAGFDDIPMARYMSPPLSSVHVDISTLGERATARLMEGVRGTGRRSGRGQRETLPTTLVIRESCGARSERATRATGPPARGGARARGSRTRH